MDIHTKCPFRNLGSRYRLKIILELQQTVGGGTYILYVCALNQNCKFGTIRLVLVLVVSGFFGAAQDGIIRHDDGKVLHSTAESGTYRQKTGQAQALFWRGSSISFKLR